MQKVLAVVLIALMLAPLAEAKKKDKKHPPVTRFVLRWCQVVEQVGVVIADSHDPRKVTDKHDELVCDCAVRSVKLDAKNGQQIIECDKVH